ncbi:MAG: polysaccharide deacetylase family protein [Bacilli bacterium]|nr:polysaccharide deacetylase family protein [Bacilli bacterium]
MKRKINKKNLTKFLVALLAIVLGVLAIIFFKSFGTKKYYSEYVLVSKNTNLYDSKNKSVGTIYKNSYLELDKYNNKKYFKIKDSDYYVYYKDINKTKKKDINIKEYYVSIGENITLKDNTKLYIDEKERLKINKGSTYEVLLKDDNYYYFRLLGNLYGVKKDDVKDVTPIKSVKKSFMSILFFENSNDNIDAQFKYLKENGNFGITLEDFNLWFNGKININNHGLFILSQNEEVLEVAKKYGIYVEQNYGEYVYKNDNTSTKLGTTSGISMYKIDSSVTTDSIKKIINGEPIVNIDITARENHQLRSAEGNATSIAVLNYHFFYDSSLGEYCGEGNCMDTKDFERELYYLKENGWKTLTMDEFIKWMYGEIELPNRSVLLTIDDGALGTGLDNGNKLMPLLEKYDLHATLFLISGWHKYSNYISPNMDVESHTYNMHSGGACDSEARGSKLLCSSREAIKEDLKISKQEIGSDKAFCYPMYVYNDKVISVLQEMGYKVAFTGGDYKATRDNDKFKIPRYHIYDSTSLDEFIDMIN